MSNRNSVDSSAERNINPTIKPYLLPPDDATHRRLDNQHDVFRLNLGSLYAAPELVRRVLAQEHPAIIDIGTGSGLWAIEMAREFPRANVVGIDIVQPILTSGTVVPPNCRFDIEDANSPLDRYANSFDVVHVRMVDMGINDFDDLFYKIARMLKPGGVILLCTALWQLFDKDHKPLLAGLEDEPGFTWTQRIVGEIYAKYIKRGIPFYNAENWGMLLRANPNYENLGHEDRFIPIGPWPSDLNEIEIRVATGMRNSILSAIEAYKSIVAEDGLSEEEVHRVTEGAIQELDGLKIHTYLKAAYAWAVRTDAPWVNRSEESTQLDSLSGLNYSEAMLNLKGLSAL